MCGRYATTRSSVDLSALFGAEDETEMPMTARFNVAPTDPVPIVRVSHRRELRVLQSARWGLLPPWAKDPRAGARMINARAETVATSRAFAPSFARRRCLVPADGWFEWVKPEGKGAKQAYYMTPADGGELAFAGLWSVWGEGDDAILTCSIITTAARATLSAVHDRMPLLLPPGRWDAWLGAPAGEESLLAPPPDDYLAGLELRPVGPAVGNVRNDGPELIAPIAADALRPAPDDPATLTLF
ncbi:SOS response-associated peptidase [Catenuloplanes nepalensis]|uniref:SOS response-associated peptidase n=1 Tax=Catenuloplanes nepalensis TaxID=587533 RepID=UPI0027D89474|nr:SOS response-associated peptidase [Catenuloplanes nepalensis]